MELVGLNMCMVKRLGTFSEDGCHFWQSKTIGRGCSRGFARTPLLGSKWFYIHRLTVYFKCPTVWKWFTSLAAIENHCLQNGSGSGSSYASHLFSHGGPAQDACVSSLRRCDERMCINKSLFQAFESSQVVLLVMSPTCWSVNLITFWCENFKSAGIANSYVDSQKLDAMLREPCSYYSSASVPKWPQKQSQSI